MLSSLPLSKVCSEGESSVVLAVYQTRVNKYSSPSQPLPQPAAPLASNADFITAQAEKLYYNCNFAQCYRLTQELVFLFLCSIITSCITCKEFFFFNCKIHSVLTNWLIRGTTIIGKIKIPNWPDWLKCGPNSAFLLHEVLFDAVLISLL